ncbi:MAG: ACT domain-containing protein [Candidatus Methanomethylophilaceae archaeon]|nr:ACT domain-containing protein [Candidatus Methanomethylophilaceae archaeon]
MTAALTKESIAELTRVYIDSHPSIKDCIAKGLINYSSLARMIMKDVGLTNEEAVMIACRRYASKLSVTTDHEISILRILKDSRLEMRTKTCIVTAKNDFTVLHKMDNLFKDLFNQNSIMQCVQSASAVTIIADRMLKDRIIDTVGRFNLIKVRENLVEISVKSPEMIVDTSGVIAYLISNLSDAGINIEETISCHTDTIFIVSEDEMINAYSALTKCIQSAETLLSEQGSRAEDSR